MGQVDYKKIGGRISDQQLATMAKEKGDTVVNAPPSFNQTSQMPGGQPNSTGNKLLYSNPKTQELVSIDANGNTVINHPLQPGIMDAAYNLTFRPIVEGVKGYGELLATAGGMAALTGLNKIDPKSQNPMITNAKNSLVEKLTPVITAQYDTPLHTIINGGLQTLGGVGAAAMAGGAFEGPVIDAISHLATTNLFFNSAYYGSGELLKSLEGKGGNLVNGALGFTNDGPFTASMGKTETAKYLDTATMLLAPILVGRVRDQLPKPDISGAFSDRTTGKLIKGALGSIPGSGEYESEKLLGKALEITQGQNHTTDIARYLDKTNPDGIISTVAKQLNDGKGGGYIPKLSEQVGPQPTDAIIDTVKNRLLQMAVGSGVDGQKLVAENGTYLKGLLKSVTEKTSGGLTNSTDLIKIDRARMDINSSISEGWFRNMDTSSTVGQTNYIRWQTSNLLKDIEAQADSTGFIRSALDVQHTAYATGPAITDISNKRLSGGIGLSRYVVSPIVNAINYFTEPVRIGLARAAQGRTTMGAQDFPEPTNIEAGTLPMLKAAVESAKTNQTRASGVENRPQTSSPETPATKTPQSRYRDFKTGKFGKGPKINQ